MSWENAYEKLQEGEKVRIKGFESSLSLDMDGLWEHWDDGHTQPLLSDVLANLKESDEWEIVE